MSLDSLDPVDLENADRYLEYAEKVAEMLATFCNAHGSRRQDLLSNAVVKTIGLLRGSVAEDIQNADEMEEKNLAVAYYRDQKFKQEENENIEYCRDFKVKEEEDHPSVDME